MSGKAGPKGRQEQVFSLQLMMDMTSETMKALKNEYEPDNGEDAEPVLMERV